MSPPRFTSFPEQAAAKMREEIGKGRWSGTVPGRDKLVQAMGVSGKTVEAALQILQKEGLLESQGPGRRRRIMARKHAAPPSMKIAILPFEPPEFTWRHLGEAQHLLTDAGHITALSQKSLAELGFDVKRVAKLVKETKADAWVVQAGSREVLEWFAKRDEPVFALFGHRRGLMIAGAGPEKIPAMREATRRLLELGHRRIVLLTRRARRLNPAPNTPEGVFLEELAARGITAGHYNLPDWEETVEGFQEGLNSLFKVTPPTAMIIDESHFFLAALQFCGNRGLRVPQDVSLVCTDGDPRFEWFAPAVSHIRWDTKPVIKRILRWADNVSRGKEDKRQIFSDAYFVEGGMIGPVKRNRPEKSA